MINKSIKYIGVILLAYTLNACNEQRMSSSSETTTPVWLAEVGKRDVRELTTTTGTAKAAKTARTIRTAASAATAKKAKREKREANFRTAGRK